MSGEQVPAEQQDCCESWTVAQQPGTDNEGYGALVGYLFGRWIMGSVPESPRFCPWCGAPKENAP